MNERERLIELLMQGELEASKQGVFNCSWSKRKAEIIADFLLDNGVIVPPVKVSGTVYINGKPAEVSFIRIENISFCIQVDCFWKDCKDCCFVDSNICNNGGYFEFTASDIGKTVFLTREEAEKALKERD